MALDLKILDIFRTRKSAYQAVFNNSPAAQEVLIDLARFCRATESCFHVDPRAHAVAEGRREVWLRITKHLNLTSQQLYALAQGHQFNPTLEELDK